MKKPEKIWMNGRFINWKDANTHVLTHSLNYGSSVFEGIRFYKTSRGTAIFCLRGHIERLFYSANLAGITIPYSKDEIAKIIKKSIKINKVKEGYIRPLFFYGSGWIQVDPSFCKPNFVIAILPLKEYHKKKMIKIRVSRFIRPHPKSTYTNAKLSGNYINSILAILDVKRYGYDEALLLDHKGYVAEGPAENFFMVKDGKIYTPKVGNILNGITRKCIIKISRDLGYKVYEKDIRPSELKNIDEAFFSGTAVGIHPIGMIGKKKIGNGDIGEITKRLMKTYSDVVAGNDKKYHSWLDFL